MSSPYPYQLATPEQLKLGSSWWCWNHDHKLGVALISVAGRVGEIRENKPEHERETRLRALRPVLGPLPPGLVKANAAWAKANAARAKANAAWAKANAAWAKENAAWAKENAAWVKENAARAKENAARAKENAAWVKENAAWAKENAAWVKENAARAKANAARAKENAAWAKENAAWVKANAAWKITEHASEIDALFAVECADVPWGPLGLIFPGEEAGR